MTQPTFDRRAALLGTAGALAVLAGCRPGENQAALAPPQTGDDPDVRWLNRLGYGPRPGDVAALRTQGREGWLEAQFKPGDEPLPLSLRLQRMPIFHLAAMELRDLPERDVIRQMQQAALLRAVHSPWQLRERMVDFWSNHFNIYAGKGLATYRKPTDEREVIRAHVFGTFPEMLRASAQSTAMLVYLDQQASHYQQPNENYARELLELHTLGVDGGYTQRDVMEVARCFTGWTEERGFLRGRGKFKFDPTLHDHGAKTVLGQTIPAGGGVEDGERVLQIVCEHPSTARHLGRKLARFLLGEEAPPSAGEAIAAAYTATSGDLPSMIRAAIEQPEFLEGPAALKRPFDFVASALRALDADTDCGQPVLDHLVAMGQPLYRWPMPDGYPDESAAWSGSLLARWNFAHALTHGQIGGTQVRLGELLARAGLEGPLGIAQQVFALAADAAPVARIVPLLTQHGSEPAQAAALALASPEFQWR